MKLGLPHSAMSPATKSKLKKSPKLPLKLSAAPSSGYNPHSGMFHILEESSSYESLSNESCSGESLDEAAKEQRRVPGAAKDKREKTRQQNERKHQRRQQRRAEEAFSQCTAFLMSRKLDLLSGQLVSMGFSQEQATRALIATGGSIGEAVAQLLETCEQTALDGSDYGLKINIDDELAMMAKMETELECSKQELYKAVVGCEGDLKRAAEVLKACRPENLHPKLLDSSAKDVQLKINIDDGLTMTAKMETELECSKQQHCKAGTGCAGELKWAAEVLKARKPESPQPNLPKRFLPLQLEAAAERSIPAPGQSLHRQLVPHTELVNWAEVDYNDVDWSHDSAAAPWRPVTGAGVVRKVVQPMELENRQEGLTEWTNAFAGRDLFSQLRKLVLFSP